MILGDCNAGWPVAPSTTNVRCARPWPAMVDAALRLKRVSATTAEGLAVLVHDATAVVRAGTVIVIAPLAAELLVDVEPLRVPEVDTAVVTYVSRHRATWLQGRLGLRPLSRTMPLNGPPDFFVPT